MVRRYARWKGFGDVWAGVLVEPYTFFSVKLVFQPSPSFQENSPLNHPQPWGKPWIFVWTFPPQGACMAIASFCALGDVEAGRKGDQTPEVVTGLCWLCTWAFMRNGWPFFPSKWRANEKQGGGWAPTFLITEMMVIKTFFVMLK